MWVWVWVCGKVGCCGGVMGMIGGCDGWMGGIAVLYIHACTHTHTIQTKYTHRQRETRTHTHTQYTQNTRTYTQRDTQNTRTHTHTERERERHADLIHEGLVDFLAPVVQRVVAKHPHVRHRVAHEGREAAPVAVFHEQDVPVVQRVGGLVVEIRAQPRAHVVAEPVLPGDGKCIITVRPNQLAALP
jgi:hypothetical protein